MDVSCAFATSLDTPAHIELAEQLGYRRAWCYDSAALYPDVWMILGMAALRTSRIELGPGVLIPSLRHPMVTAAAVATLAELAPGRVVLGIGSGFTGRVSLGQKPMRWVDVDRYVVTLRHLLGGEKSEWDGAPIAMLQRPGGGATRPIDVPILIGADGPRGSRVATERGDGIFSATPAVLAAATHEWRALLTWGTVLDVDESPSSPRVVEAVAPAIAVLYHVLYERGGAGAVDALPNGATWRAAVESVPPGERHLVIHAGHQVELDECDALLFPPAGALAGELTMVGSPHQVREQLSTWSQQGISEVVYQPGGPDIARELRAFAAATADI